MGIYINTLNIPKDGEILSIDIYPDGKVCTNLDLECKLIATAVPVNKGHGRLIDADAFSNKILEVIESQKYYDFYTQKLSVGDILCEVVHELNGMSLTGYANAQTIIPADDCKV